MLPLGFLAYKTAQAISNPVTAPFAISSLLGGAVGGVTGASTLVVPGAIAGGIIGRVEGGFIGKAMSDSPAWA